MPPVLLEHILATIGEGVTVHDATSRLVGHNRAAEIILGLTTDEMKAPFQLPPPASAQWENGERIRPDELPASVALRTGVPVENVLMRITRRDGSTRWIRGSARPVIIAGDQMAVSTFADVTDLRLSLDDVWHLAHRDPLTGLVTRLKLEQLCEAAVERATVDASRVAIIAFGLDHFSLLNQRLGALAGDEALVQSSERLSRAMRPNSALARIGSDQFGVLVEQAGDDADLAALALELRALAEEPLTVGGTTYIPSVSVGVASFPTDAATHGDLLIAAQGALDEAKRQERGSVLFFHDFSSDLGVHYAVQQGIRRAIDLGSVRLWYQRVVTVNSLRDAGVEALFRLDEDGESGSGMLTPEILGSLGPRIARRVLRLLMDDARRMRDAGQLPAAISVNLTAADLLIPSIKDEAAAVARELAVMGSRLIVEVSEQVGLRDPALIRPMLKDLQAESAAICLDDFGTGTNSLALLRELPLDSLKLDSSFIVGAMSNPIDRAIIRAAVTLADELDLTVVAEGVENEAILDFVRDQGIGMAQGYYFDRPGPIPDDS